ncbi:MAG: MerR family transcriptional regulator [Pseudobacter sp.]|uniref:MerR family transcriptional regulator n=1 Tax=Pseudobacter sp. TaxID=2045420 RepID=UPI003F816018
MNIFSIRDIENMTGIKAHTLRIWEQRHNIFNPKRKESKHRFYDCEDLKYILRVAYLYNRGIKISRIAGMTQEEIRERALELQPDSENYEIYVNQLTEAALDFDQPLFEKILNTLLLHAGFERSMFNVVFPLLKHIGLLWLAGKAHPCQEHFASALIIKKIHLSIDGLDCPAHVNTKRKVLLFTPEMEFHEISILFMQYLLKKQGVPTIYVGRNASLEVLQGVADSQKGITQVYFHLVTNLIRCDLKTYLQRISAMFPSQQIYFSSSSLVHSIPPNVKLLNGKEALLNFAAV